MESEMHLTVLLWPTHVYFWLLFLQAIPESDIKQILTKNEEELQKKAEILQVRKEERGRE